MAVGTDLRPATLLDAYRHGIFPWPDRDGEVHWWSPDPRAVFPVGGVHVSRSLRRTLRSGRFTTTVDTAFDEVVAGCQERDEGTWITPELRAAFGELHRLGHAHSIEVWSDGDRLVGGLYGIAVGAVFCGESMFHRVTDASKVAMVELDRRLAVGGFVLFDAQLPTPHLASMGARVIRRDDYLDLLTALRDRPAVLR